MKYKNVHRRYHDIAKERFAADDFLGQVARTVEGKAVDPAQHEMIVDRVLSALAPTASDVLLDLACGNGLVSDRIFERCSSGVGVDFSEYLIGVAKRHFERPGLRDYVEADIVEFVATVSQPWRFTKALCYGAFAYLTASDARELLATMRKRCTGVERFFIGNLPNKERVSEFFEGRNYAPGIENDNDSDIGLWRTPAEFEALGRETGWHVTVGYMPQGFFGSYYRYDALLTPAN